MMKNVVVATVSLAALALVPSASEAHPRFQLGFRYSGYPAYEREYCGPTYYGSVYYTPGYYRPVYRAPVYLAPVYRPAYVIREPLVRRHYRPVYRHHRRW